jgi:hypothetical protein
MPIGRLASPIWLTVLVNLLRADLVLVPIQRVVGFEKFHQGML